MRRCMPIAALVLMLSGMLAANEVAEQAVEEAWESWKQNNSAEVEKHFQQALALEPENLRAHIGLAYFYQLQQNYNKAWEHFRHTLNGEDYQPYLFSAKNTARMALVQNDSTSGIMEMLRRMSDEAQNNDMLTAMAHQEMGDYYRKKGDLARSDEYYARTRFLTDWTVIGPFENVSASGFEKVLPPEGEYKAGRSYTGKNGMPATWFRLEKWRPDGWIDFRRYFAYENSVHYGNCFINSPEKQKVHLRIGTSGSLKAFLNDEEVISYFDENNNDLDTYIVETELQKGWNRLLLKVGYSEISQCNYMVRITDTAGKNIELGFSTAPQNYKKKPGAAVKAIDNFAEVFFRNRIKANPGHLENYLLLADCYLRNDKAIEGELALREALSRAPECALFYEHLIEAYRRGEKDDDVSTALEKMYLLDPNLPSVLVYKFNQASENGQIDEAEALLNKLEAIVGPSEAVYSLRLGIHSNRRDIEKLIETSRTGYATYPASWSFALMESNISIQTTRSYGRAVEIYTDFLKQDYNVVALSTLASTYLKASDVDSWESTYTQILDMDEAARGAYFQMATTYISLQKYDKAQDMLLQALALCPNNSVYWAKLGEVHRAVDNKPQALKAYQTALNFDPSDYEAREQLRELQGKPPVTSYFEEVDIARVIAEAPAADEVEDDVMVLLDDVKRVVYQRGASEMFQEYMVKVFNKRGIDNWKEYRISFNGYTETLVIEKAVVIKPDGSEIQADESGNYLAFKSLEENDIIYMKWKVKNYYSGKLAGQFWDQFFFNGYYPVKHSRYSLLLPSSLSFQHKTQHMAGGYRSSKTAEGILHVWETHEEPAIQYEYDMPILQDVGKMLHISSIDSWEYMVDWYADVAHTKARSSFEIREQVEKLFAGRENPSEEEKIRTIYNFITENIRYSSISFRQSALIPQKARDVLVNRIGDCKDVAGLCIAMLREVDIDAHYVLINTRDEGSNAVVLPSIAFNHCITGVETQNGVKYLDLTASNYPYGTIPEMDRRGFALLIRPDSRAPFYLNPEGYTPRNLLRQAQVEVRPDNAISVQKKSVKSGSMAASMRSSYRDQPQTERERTLTETLAHDYNNVRLSNFEVDNLNAVNEPFKYSYGYVVEDYVNEVGNFKFLKVPWTESAEPDRALSYEERLYPYQYWPRADTLREEVEILLPSGYEPLELGENVDLSSSIADYHLQLSYQDGVIRGVREFINKQEVVQPQDYLDFRRFYRQVLKQDERFILLQRILQN